MKLCGNEQWLAAYLDKMLARDDRRLYEMHLSRCPKCLAELIAAKAELDELVAEEAGLASDRIPVPEPRRARLFRPAAVAAAISIAAVVVLTSVFLLLRHVSIEDRAAAEAQAGVTEILAAADIGEMRLFGGPDSPLTRSAVFRGAHVTARDQSDRIETLLQALLDGDHNDWRIQAALGDLCIATNQIDRADNFYAQALVLEPRSARLLNGRGVAAYRLGDFDGARTYLSQALEIDGGSFAALYNLAVLCHVTGDRVATKRYVGAYLQRDPSSPWSERARALARE
jgi:tetratricopeptide (TPR) repeat protein